MSVHASQRIEPGPAQESVWDYPRPPRVEAAGHTLRVVHGGVTVAETARGLRVVETSQPPAYYFPPEDVALELLHTSSHRSWCEWKGMASYMDLHIGDEVVSRAAWYYPAPDAGYEVLADHLAFYPQKVEACYVGEERVEPNEGDFYGGWITSLVVGPFKGAPGTAHW